MSVNETWKLWKHLWNAKNRGTEESFLSSTFINSNRTFFHTLIRERNRKFLCLPRSTHLPWPFLFWFPYSWVTSVFSQTALDTQLIWENKTKQTNKKCVWLFLASTHFLLISFRLIILSVLTSKLTALTCKHT